MAHDALFTPLHLGPLTLPNRILMAPLTRCRADHGHIPNAMMAEHYAQRASAGLIIAEATMAMAGNSAFYAEPGIYNQAQIEGWQQVTDAVHQAGGRIFLQIWHGGRACHPLFNDGAQPVAPSAIPITNSELHTPDGKKPYVTPRALTTAEIPDIVAGFQQAAKNAKAAGFDGVEIHSANGYLLDSFLRDGANHRTDHYGGSLENRTRLLVEILEALIPVWGGDRLGVRISPLNSFNSMVDSDPVGLSIHVAKTLAPYNLAYLHVMRGDLLGEQTGDVLTPIRDHYPGVLIGNVNYSPTEAAAAVSQGLVDAIAFGQAFIANPDLPARIHQDAPFSDADPTTFYTPGPKGYTDYPSLSLS